MMRPLTGLPATGAQAPVLRVDEIDVDGVPARLIVQGERSDDWPMEDTAAPPQTPQVFRAAVNRQIQQWDQFIRTSGIKLE